MREYGHKIQKYVGITYGGGEMLWNITVNAGYMNGHFHVAFGVDWKQFMEYHDMLKEIFYLSCSAILFSMSLLCEIYNKPTSLIDDEGNAINR